MCVPKSSACRDANFMTVAFMKIETEQDAIAPRGRWRWFRLLSGALKFGAWNVAARWMG